MHGITPKEWLQKAAKESVNLLVGEGTEETVRQFKRLEAVYGDLTAVEQAYIHRLLRERFEVGDAVYVLSCIIHYTELADFWQDVAWWVIHGELDCFAASMLEIQYSCSANPIYAQRREMHRRNIERLQSEIGWSAPYIEVKKRNRNRITIITEQLLMGIQHAPTEAVLKFSYVLQKYLGYEVRVVVCPSNRVLLHNQWIVTQAYNSGVEGQSTILVEGEQIEISCFPMAECGRKEYARMLSEIYAWNPVFVLAVGVENPVADLPRQFTTVVSMALTIEAPVSEAQILIRYMRRNDVLEYKMEQELGAHQKQCFMDEKLPAVIPQPQKQYTRAELNLPDEKFLIAVVGNRLDQEVDEAFTALMREVLEQNLRIDFVVIGQVEKLPTFFLEERFRNRVHFIGYCDDLISVYRVLDLYLNPKRLGGGWSSAMALAAGLPVVTLPECDVAYNVGEEFTVSDFREVVKTVERYAADPVFYEEKVQRALQTAVKSGDEKMTAYLKMLISKIRELMEPGITGE